MTTDERDPDLVNPDWQRPDDWPWEEDHDSPKWKRRWSRIQRRIQIGRKKYGFSVCPECEVMHTGLTVTCRGCGHKAEITDEMTAAVDAQLVEELGDGSEFASACVPIITNPTVPKDAMHMFVTIREAARHVFQEMTYYLETGDINAMRRAVNALLVQSTARTRGTFTQLMGTVMTAGEHPLTEEERQAAREELHIREPADI